MRQFITIVESAEPDASWTPEQVVAYGIEQILAQNPGKTPHQINRGQCDELADLLENTDRSIERNRFQSIELGNLFRYVDGEEVGYDTRLLKRHWPHIKPFAGLTWRDMFDSKKANLNWTGTHIWAYCTENDLHYDIETPRGVKNPFNLGFFSAWHKDFGLAG